MAYKETLEAAAYSAVGLIIYYIARGFFSRTFTSLGFPFVVGY